MKNVKYLAYSFKDKRPHACLKIVYKNEIPVEGYLYVFGQTFCNFWLVDLDSIIQEEKKEEICDDTMGCLFVKSIINTRAIVVTPSNNRKGVFFSHDWIETLNAKQVKNIFGVN